MNRRAAALPAAPKRSAGASWSLWLLWLAVAVAIPVWMHFDAYGWDFAVYARAVQALRLGGDPYASAMAVQTAAHLNGGVAAGLDPPWSYVYSPVTLPVLRLMGLLPQGLGLVLYWSAYVFAVIAQAWVGLQLAEGEEMPVARYLVPVAAFFPGLLANGTVLGGNIAYLLYAAALLAALRAWRGNSWNWFYGVVLVASCVKAPLLSLAVVPVVTARGQWRRAAATVATGIGLFAVQSLLWPELFAHYLQAVSLQFAYNRDFGCSPAGLVSGLLYDHRLPYTTASALCYLCYAIPVLAALLYFSRLYFRGLFTLREWVPVVLVGVILLNPRLIEYDVAPIAIPLALVSWRSLRAVWNRQRATWMACLAFAVLNAMGLASWNLRKALDGPLLVMVFALGCVVLQRESRSVESALAELELARAHA